MQRLEISIERIKFIQRGFYSLVFFIFSFSSHLLASGDDSMFIKRSVDSIAIHVPVDREVLSKYISQAETFCLKNLNRFGLYELQRYDVALDSVYKRELNDTLKSFKGHYLKAHESRNVALGTLNSQIKLLTVQKDEAQKRFNKLLKKAVFASLIWLAIVILLILLRSRTLRNAQTTLDNSNAQVRNSENNFEAGRELLQFTKSNDEKITAIKNEDDELQRAAVAHPQAVEAGMAREEASALQFIIKNIHGSTVINYNLDKTILSQEFEAADEKTPANLNQLCDQCMDTVYHGMQHYQITNDEAFNCSVTKDLEKNLPPIKVNTQAVIYLLMNVMKNAFQSVHEKKKQGVKGYSCKVSVSTRVLPRFLQIRIKDNGIGMTDEMIARISEPFYTNHIDKESAGLGMYFAKKIISEMHKGEMKIESRVGDGTDVYIKFFT